MRTGRIETDRMIAVHGLQNCDTCRKALKWLDAEGIAHSFHDVRADGLDAATLARWIAAAGWETLLNTRGTTWRKLDESARADVDEARAAALMLAHPALIKRPVFEADGQVLIGFTDSVRDAIAATV